MPRAAEAQVTAAALALAAVAGYVDALGFQLLRGVFTSHMTGDTAHLGSYAVGREWNDAVRFGWPILTFTAGLFLSGAITAIGKKRRFHSTFGVALALEAILLFSSPAITNYYALAATLAGAMGIQTLTVTRVHGLRIYTTYMTGNLAKFAEGAVQYLARGDRIEMRHSVVALLLWAMFLAGIVAGAAAHAAWDRAAASPAGAVIAVMAILDFTSPIDPAEEIRDLRVEAK